MFGEDNESTFILDIDILYQIKYQKLFYKKKLINAAKMDIGGDKTHKINTLKLQLVEQKPYT